MTGSSGVPTAEYEIVEDALSRRVGGETVIIDLATEEYFGLDEVGSVLWAGLEEARSLPEIVDRVVDRFDVTRERAAADLALLVGSLVGAGLVRERRNAPT